MEASQERNRGRTMKFTQAVKSYNNPKLEGWVTQGTIFNVGKVHREGLRVITAARADQLIKARLHVEYSEGDTVLAPSKNDPVAAKVTARKAAGGAAKPTQQERQDDRRQTKVDPPPVRKEPRQDPRPTAPRRAADVVRQPSPQTTPPLQKSDAGSPTGQTRASQSSSAAAPAAKPSTGQRRGMRRGDAAAVKRAGSQSTKPGASSPKETPSTEPTGPGGNTEKA